MSEVEFTKGPWFPVETDNEITVSCDDYDIATIWVGLSEANLIACAPEMYEMLELLREDYGILTSVGKDIDSLLSKARGES